MLTEFNALTVSDDHKNYTMCQPLCNKGDRRNK